MKIYVECKPDEVLLKSLGIKEITIEHAHGKGNICNKLKKNKNAFGLLDEDPQSVQPKYLKNLKCKIINEFNIKLFYDENSNNFLIILCPRLEEWILESVKELKIDIKEYNLPDDANNLHKIINAKLSDFEKLICKLKESKRIKKLKELLLNI
jgi:hypothetical protein